MMGQITILSNIECKSKKNDKIRLDQNYGLQPVVCTLLSSLHFL